MIDINEATSFRSLLNIISTNCKEDPRFLYTKEEYDTDHFLPPHKPHYFKTREELNEYSPGLAQKIKELIFNNYASKRQGAFPEAVRLRNIYGESVQTPEDSIWLNIDGYGLQWVKDLQTYVLQYDPRLLLHMTQYDGTWQEEYIHDNLGDIFICDESDNFILREEAVTAVDSGATCHRIYAERNFYLNSNGDWHENFQEESSDESRNLLAEDGLDDYETDPAALWGFKKLGTYKDKYTECFFGLELEYEYCDDSSFDERENTSEAFHEVQCAFCHDGSLNDGGEVKTPPCSFEYLMESSLLEDIVGICENFNLDSANSAGMHVHVSKAALTPLQISKMRAFICNPANKPFMLFIAGRNPERYAALMSEPINIVKIPLSKNDIQKGNKSKHSLGGGNRYVALNLRNPLTAEFRIFRSTCSLPRIRANIQFCKALVDFCNHQINPLPFKDTLSVTAFCEFVSNNRKEFNDLYSLIIREYPAVAAA